MEAKSKSGCTALRYAVEEKAIDTVRLLIKNGANPEGCDLSWMDDEGDR